MTGVWPTCVTEYDSLCCHRYVREVGAFRRDDEASVAAAAAASVNAVVASGAAASSARDNDSKKALEHQGRLECFVMKHARNTEFGEFIVKLGLHRIERLQLTSNQYAGHGYLSKAIS